MLHKCLIGVPRSKLMKIKLITTASTYLMFVHSLFLLQLYQGSINPCTLNSTGQFWCNEHQFALANIYSTTMCKNEEKHSSINTFQSLDQLISSTAYTYWGSLLRDQQLIPHYNWETTRTVTFSPLD